MNNKYKNVPEKVLAIIEQVTRDINFGSITLVIQDSCVVQIERVEKIIIDNRKEEPCLRAEKNPDVVKATCAKILAEIKDLHYGQLVVKIKDGRAIQFEKTEKRRFPEVEGQFGDGI